MNQNVVEIDVGEVIVEIKARREPKLPSGWSVIAFTPNCSVRCSRVNMPRVLDSFVWAILAVSGVRWGDDAPETEMDYINVAEAIHKVTETKPYD
jgi:hypothetical protein